MRKLLTLILSSVSLICLGQFPNSPSQGSAQTNNTFLGAVTSTKGFIYKRYRDTVEANLDTYTKTVPFNTISVTGNVLYQRNINATKWVRISGMCEGLIGGSVAYSGTGLTFNVSPATQYCINNNSYSSQGGSITLNAANPSNPRIDVIFVDTSGLVGKLTGTAAANPSIPQINPASQYYLTSVLIPANATTPGGITTTVVYDENTEWATSFSGTGTVNFNSTSFPYHLSKNTLLTPVSGNVEGVITFQNGTNLQTTSYSTLVLYVRQDAVPLSEPSLAVGLGLNGNPITSYSTDINPYGFSSSVSGAYQTIAVPISDLPITSTTFNQLYIKFQTSVGTHIDYVQLQSGINPPPQTTTPIDMLVTGGQSNAVGNPGSNAGSPSIANGIAYQYYNGVLTPLTSDPVGNANLGSAWTSFAVEYFNKTGRKICFVPCAVNGSSQVFAADTGGLGTWDNGGTLYANSVTNINNAIQALGVAGFSPTLKGLLWCQGETDSKRINQGVITINDYTTAFNAMMVKYRNQFGANFPIYIFRIGTWVGESDAGYAAVRNAQMGFMTADPLRNKVVFQNALDFPARGLMTDNVHYSQGGYNEMGRIGAQEVVNAGENAWQFQAGNLYTTANNVGIGISLPTSPFHLKSINVGTPLYMQSDRTGLSVARFENTNAGAASGAGLRLYNDVGLAAQIIQGSNGYSLGNNLFAAHSILGDMQIGSNTGDLLFGTNAIGPGNGVKARIKQSGSFLLGTSTEATSSIFTAVSTERGAIHSPVMSETNRAAILSPATGLHVFTTKPKWYDGIAWRTALDSATAASLYGASNWSLTGNSGTSPGTNFLGTTDDKDIVFKRNNVTVGRLGKYNSSGGNIGFGDQVFGTGVTTANNNTSFGDQSMMALTTGTANAAFGSFGTLKALTSGTQNTAVGVSALGTDTSGSYNTAIGANALGTNRNGNYNIALGSAAGTKNMNGNYELYINSWPRTGSDKLLDTTWGLVFARQAFQNYDSQRFKINGRLHINDGTQGIGKVFTDVAGDGIGHWVTPSSYDSLRRLPGSTQVEGRKNGVWYNAFIDSTGGGGVSEWTRSGSRVYPNNITDTVSIGTVTPLAKLHVAGNTILNGNVGINTTAMGGFNFRVSGSSDFTSTVNAQGNMTVLGAFEGYGPYVYGNTLSGQKLGIGFLSPGASVQIKAGTASAGTAPLKLTSGTNLTTPESGAVEYDGTHFYGTNSSGTRLQLDQSSGQSISSWQSITSTTKTLVAGEGYISASTSNTQLVYTLPASPNVGDIFALVGSNGNSGGWKIAQNASQFIVLAGNVTTAGVTGYLQSATKNDAVTLVYTGPNTFTVQTVVGSPTAM